MVQFDQSCGCMGLRARDALMCGSRKPQDGGGSGTPGASRRPAPARGRPGVGTHSAGSRPGVGAHGPGSGRLTFGRAFRGSLLGSCHHVRLTFVGPRRGRDERRCRGALLSPRPSRRSSARSTFSSTATCSRSPGPTCPGSTARGRDSPGRRPARGRPGVGTHSGSALPRYDIHYESPGVPDPPPSPGFRDR